jgi:hypothetical protein
VNTQYVRDALIRATGHDVDPVLIEDEVQRERAAIEVKRKKEEERVYQELRTGSMCVLFLSFSSFFLTRRLTSATEQVPGEDEARRNQQLAEHEQVEDVAAVVISFPPLLPHLRRFLSLSSLPVVAVRKNIHTSNCNPTNPYSIPLSLQSATARAPY